jgi:ribonuclease HI
VTDERPLVAVYADESCIGNGREGDNPGGAAGLIEWKSPRTGRITLRDYWISEPATTNNRMALRSVIEAFRALAAKSESFDVVFTSDSKYIVEGMRSWRHSWKKAGWRRKGGPIMNLELWQVADLAVEPHRVLWRWVKGHNAQAQNEYANYLAMRAARSGTASDGLEPSRFHEWLAEERSKGRMHREPDPFPEAAIFDSPSLRPAASARPQ